MTLLKHVEFVLEDANGNLFTLEFPSRHNTAISGLGMPPVRHWTTRAPFQTGESHWGYAIRPRVVNLGLLLKACDRDEYWDRRMANVEMFSPLNGPLKLRLRRYDGHVYELQNGWFTAGYELSATDTDDPFQIEGASQITFYDPIWKWLTSPLDAGETRDADGRTCVQTSTFSMTNTLTLPFSGPFTLGCSAGTATLTCVNDGTWEVNPVITIAGPVDDWTLENATTGDEITWDGYQITAGEIVTLNVKEKTVTNAAGDDLIVYVGGDFGTFTLTSGSNTLNFEGLDNVSNGVTTVGVCWYLEVLGM